MAVFTMILVLFISLSAGEEFIQDPPIPSDNTIELIQRIQEFITNTRMNNPPEEYENSNEFSQEYLPPFLQLLESATHPEFQKATFEPKDTEEEFLEINNKDKRIIGNSNSGRIPQPYFMPKMSPYLRSLIGIQRRSNRRPTACRFGTFGLVCWNASLRKNRYQR